MQHSEETKETVGGGSELPPESSLQHPQCKRDVDPRLSVKSKESTP